jgi:hypothetical protein
VIHALAQVQSPQAEGASGLAAGCYHAWSAARNTQHAIRNT